MKYQIHKAVVIGSGTMGAALAAHLANAGVPVTLLDIVPKGAAEGNAAERNKIVNEGWDRCIKAKPANLMSADLKTLVTLGNLEDDFDVIAGADWVIEAIVEDLKIKQSLMARIDAVRKPGGIVSTNTSGIPVKDIAEGRSKGFRQHFLGTHFFNPPRYLKLLEIIPTEDTLPEVVEFIGHFGEMRLGKGIVLCKDTPNFIGNRVAFGTGAFALDYILANDYSVDEVDAVTGPLMGRPKTATFRLIDLVGVDVWDHVGRNLAPAIPHDRLAQKYLGSEAANQLIAGLIERKWLGNKTKTGFYKEVRSEDGKKEFWPLDLKTLEHIPPSKPRFDSVKAAKDLEGLKDKLGAMLEADDKAAKLVQALTYQGFQYASTLLPEIADSPKPIDDAVRWGFQHEAGPFETWDMLGVAETAKRMKKAGYPAAKWVKEMLKAGVETFYQYKNGVKTAVYDVVKQKYVKLKKPSEMLLLSTLRGTKKVISQNSGASLYDIGDGVSLLEFHTKMNSLDEDIFNMFSEALDRLDDFDGLVVGNEAEHFSAGANLALILMGAKMGQWETLDQAMRKLQGIAMRIRYSPKPVVIAPAGLALGGGRRADDAREPGSGRSGTVHRPGGGGDGPDPGGRRHEGDHAAGDQPGDEDRERGGLPIHPAGLPADRAGKGRHVRGRSARHGDPGRAGPDRNEPRATAHGGQARSHAHGGLGIPPSCAGDDLRAGEGYVRGDGDRRLAIPAGRVYHRIRRAHRHQTGAGDGGGMPEPGAMGERAVHP